MNDHEKIPLGCSITLLVFVILCMLGSLAFGVLKLIAVFKFVFWGIA